MAVYNYLPRCPGQKSYRTMRFDPSMVLDFSRSGKHIGIEITAPSKMSLPAINRVLRELGFATLKRADFVPLRRNI